jgi:uncharacterized protein (TIGR00255 family)
MITSMTGFGQAERACADWLVRVEVRTVNHRDLQTTFRLPDAFSLREVDLQKIVEANVHRGHLYLTLTCEPRQPAARAPVDAEIVSAYVAALRQVAAQLQVPFQADLASVLRLPGALHETSADREMRESLWDDVVATCREALADLLQMRRAEGQSLSVQLLDLCDVIARLTDEAEQAQRDFVPAYRDRLRERVDRLLEGTDIHLSEDLLAREVAVYADRSDVSEEIARMRSHLEQFRAAVDGPGEPVGRKMEFIGQEMLREAGTMAAKTPAGRQLPQALELKSVVEKLREQVRNVE